LHQIMWVQWAEIAVDHELIAREAGQARWGGVRSSDPSG
jgi:hypothetical protein